ncbi:hypothetical protein N8707_00265 [Candidatus Pelagibacter sp.]|nr:hypothetical protein [Candidatus Pelagibacter sp.]
MQFLFIFLITYLLILGLYSLGSVFHYFLKQTQSVSNIITGYALICILSNFLFFGLNIDTKLISLFFVFVIFISLIFLLYKKENFFFINIKKILFITVFPIIFFLTIGFIYGEQYYVFRGNYWDYFNYVSSALLYSDFNFSEVLSLKEKSDLPLFFKTALASQNSRPLVMLIMSYFYNFKFIDIFLLSYLFKVFITSLSTIAFFCLLKNFFKKNKFQEILIITVTYILSFWNLYIIEIDAISQLASLSIFLLLLSKIKEIFKNLRSKNYNFYFYIAILFSAFFLLYPELSIIYVLIVLIFGLISKSINLRFLRENYVIIFLFILLFLILTITNYKTTYIFLFEQSKDGLFKNNNWWGYFGSFILGRENPVMNPDFVNLLKDYLENSTNIKSTIIWLNDNLTLFDYKYYQFNILPSVLGFYFLTDMKILGGSTLLNVFILLLLSIYLIFIILRNVKIVLSLKDDFNILIKSSFLVILSLFILLINNFQIWSIIKLYFYFSIFYFLFIILFLEHENKYLKFRINYPILMLIIIFPLYKFSNFNNGILRYDSFPSIMNTESKKSVNWHFDATKFAKCKHIELDFNKSKIDNFKKLYLSINLKYNDFIFIDKNMLVNSSENIDKLCKISNNYFKKS